MVDPYIAQLDVEIAELKGRIAGLEQARSLYERLRHEASAPAVSVTPFQTYRQASPARRPSRLRETVWAVLGAHPDGLTSRQVNDIVRSRDPSINDKTVTSMLSVAARDGELQRDLQGRYHLPGAGRHQPDAGEADADGAEDAAASDDLSEDEHGGYEFAAA